MKKRSSRKDKIPLTFDQLRVTNVRRCETAFNHNLKAWTPLEWGGALAGEAGELCNFLKKLKRGEKVDIKDIAYEIADVVTYCDLLAASFDIDLGETVREKFNLVSDRKKTKIRL